MGRQFLRAGLVLFLCAASIAAVEGKPEYFVNSTGMKFVLIGPGSFVMGAEEKIPAEAVARDNPGRRVGEPKEPAMWEGTKPGLIGAIINNQDQSDSRVKKVIEQVVLNWETETAGRQKQTAKSARWRGLIRGPISGKVTFSIEANDEVRLFVNHEPVIDATSGGGAESCEVEMTEGKFAAIAIDTEKTAYTRLYWSWPATAGREGQKKTVVPAGAFFHSAADENMIDAYLSWIPSQEKARSRDGGSTKGDYDEVPRRKVTITQPFYISETEVTISQFRQFKAEYPGYEKFKPYVCGISWNDAAAFCKWLSDKEGKPYRLPTEAEWEYVCRAGTQTVFGSGNKVPEHETANAWGVKNMHTGVREWCQDWYAVYPEQAQSDPAGPAHGSFKVVRGGNLDWTTANSPFYARSSNRGAAAPDFGPPPLEYQLRQLQNAKLSLKLPQQVMEEAQGQYKIGELDDTNVTLCEALNTPFRYTGLAGRWSIRTSGFIPGRHEIGFRVVQAPMPKMSPSTFEGPFVHRCVKQKPVRIKQGPDQQKPYYRTRLLFPNFSGASLVEAWRLGIEQGYGGGHHNSALEVLPNGDLMAAYYNTIFGGEREACVSIMSMRFRRGADEWDMPSSWPDNVDSDDEGPVIWNDNGTLWFFWGSPRQMAGYPFQYVKSKDNGATWGPVNFPLFDKRVGPYAAQPINSAFRDSKKTIYLAVDGSHSPLTSLLFASQDEGRTWYDTGGRTYGRHSTFIVLENDVIMAFAGKQAEINGFHPLNISTDGGGSYKVSASTLPALGGGTRASLIKLASGRLFYVADMHLGSYRKLSAQQCPEGFAGEGAYAALSDDKGKTWKVRKLTGGNVPGKDGQPARVHTVSYVTARQAPDGIIHVVTSHNNPDLHFELNEAWILQDLNNPAPPAGQQETTIIPATVKEYGEKYPSGAPRVTYSAGNGEDGRYLLHGTEIWHYENGQKELETSYCAGRRIGAETYWSRDGAKRWQKVHKDDGSYEWTVWGPDGKVTAKSVWRGKTLLSHEIIK